MRDTRGVSRRPSILQEMGALLLTVVLVGIAAGLGWWQLGAWQARRAAEARDLTQNPPVAMTDVLGPDDPFPAPDVGRPVTVEGTWLPEGRFWVSDRQHDGRDGYWAVTPLRLGEAGTPAVLVVQGWAESPQGPAPTGTAEVTGWLQPPEGGTVTDDDASDDIFPEIRVADAVQRVDTDLYSAYVVADPARSADVTGDLAPADLASLPEVGRFTALKNLLYAIEWWVFGAFAAFVWWRWRQDARDEEASYAA
ncbi:SURF1 family protein [Nocardioides seonyuensis]|uniref:SURF1-like protein n=1 Tax=Nocardioides seonyuensis TaxID=2518371 RepID=A0A4P7IDP3_9ACTN|nr:SURF1 family protein [Nocardioides seonyuensis]